MKRLAWFDAATPVDDVTIEIGFMVRHSFCFETERGGLPVPLDQPRTPRVAGVAVLTRDLTPCAGELVRHYRDVLRRLGEHGLPERRAATCFWLRPFVLAAGRPVLTFPWHSWREESEWFLDRLAADRPADLFWKEGGDWELTLYGDGDRLCFRQRGTERGGDGTCIACDRATMNAQLPGLRRRLGRVLEELAFALGGDYWSRAHWSRPRPERRAAAS